jgi:hypothetical protein
VVLQLGIRFAIELPDGPSRGYVVEVFDGHFQLPDLGPIGMYPPSRNLRKVMDEDSCINCHSILKHVQGSSLSILASRISLQESRSLSTCMKAEELSQVACSHSTPISLLPIFGQKTFFHLPSFS